MYFIHHFAHLKSLARAQEWMSYLGFGPHEFQAHPSTTPWMTVSIDAAQRAEVQLLFNALERSEPNSFPGFWDLGRRPALATSPLLPDETSTNERPKVSSIGWHPPDVESGYDPDLQRIRDAMSHSRMP
ncbi:hypothetical protein ACYOEI_08765 [Singulisphaera rosea]